MQKRVARATVISILLVATIATSLVLLSIEGRSTTIMAEGDDVSATLDRVHESLAGIGVAQLGYLAPGQLDQPWFERTSTLIERLSVELSQARATVRSAEARASLADLTEAVGSLETADLRARQNLRLGQDLMAADVILGDGLNIVDTMTETLRRLQGAERAQQETDLRAIARTRWITLGVMVTALVTGLFALAPMPKIQPVTGPASSPALAARDAPSEPAPAPPLPLPTDHAVDLTSIARLCTDLSTIASAGPLPDLLRRSATALNASGVVLWIGEEDRLFPVLAHGYPAESLSRMGPVARDERNAAATVWRTGEPATVEGTPTSAGAVVVPLLETGGCLGVLACEVPHGREHDEPTHAVATLIAAQLAGLVRMRPADVQTPPSTETTVDPTQERAHVG
jgi:hypothetical protein